MKLFEFVCVGNHGRSPFLEGAANDYLEEKGMKNVRAVSSGIGANRMNRMFATGLMKNNWLKWFLKKGLERKLFENETEVVNGLLKQKSWEGIDYHLVQHYALRAFNVFFEEEENYRNHSAGLLLRRRVKERSEQTIVREDCTAVFGMTQKEVDYIDKLYFASGKTPLIDIASKYAGMHEDGFEHVFGGAFADYHVAAAKMKECARKIIDRLEKESIII